MKDIFASSSISGVLLFYRKSFILQSMKGSKNALDG